MKKEFLNITRVASIFLSIINYCMILFVILFATRVPENSYFWVNTHILIIVLFNFLYLFSVYLEYKAYETRKKRYLILAYILSFFIIIPPILGIIIKLILLTIILVWIKENPQKSQKVVTNTDMQEKENITLKISMLLSIIYYGIVLFFSSVLILEPEDRNLLYLIFIILVITINFLFI